MATFFEDEEFQNRLVGLIVWDTPTCQQVGHLLEADDFKPVNGMREGRSRWVAATCALNYFQKHQEPIRRLLRSEVLAYSQDLLGDREVKEAVTFSEKILKTKVVGAESIVEKVVKLKSERLKTLALQEMIELQSRGELTDEKWAEISRTALTAVRETWHISDYLEGVDARIQRRKYRSSYPPLMMIDPLDQLVVGPNRGQLALIGAPYKRGKSLFLSHLAQAYALQQLRVAYFTLEDPLEEVENRLDAAIAAIPIAKLKEMPRTLKERFQRFRRLLRSRIKVIDGTGDEMGVTQIENILDKERDGGFFADVLLIDYDEELTPSKRAKEKRFEIDATYRHLRRAISKRKLYGWMAAQTKRDTSHLKVLTGDHLAEDIGKIKKAHLAITMGQGDWSDDSIYLWVAAHKFDKQHVGCHIIPDKSRMILFDRERTRRAALENEETDEEM